MTLWRITWATSALAVLISLAQLAVTMLDPPPARILAAITVAALAVALIIAQSTIRKLASLLGMEHD